MESPKTAWPARRAALDPATEILKKGRTIAVVGLSSKTYRPSYGVAEYLQSAGYRIVPVNPNESEVLAEKSYPRLEDIPFPVDVVCLFRRSEYVSSLMHSAIAIGARAIWMQEGVVDQESAEIARQAGLLVVMDACMMKEHVKRFRVGRP